MIKATTPIDFPPVVIDWNPPPESPEEIAKHKERRQIFRRNSKQFESMIQELYAKYSGKYVCVSGGQVFVADTAKQALELARTAYPDEYGVGYFQYLSTRWGPKIYAI